MFKLLFLVIGITTVTSIYDYTIRDIDGNQVSLESFRGKKMLLVNIASDSKYADQIASLEKLHQLYKDSLVIIAFPSNSFGNEAADNSTIKSSINQRYKVSFILAQKIQVAKNDREPVYGWLTESGKNKVVGNDVKNDFFKFLIDQSGNLVGIFNSSVDPMSEELLSAIRN